MESIKKLEIEAVFVPYIHKYNEEYYINEEQLNEEDMENFNEDAIGYLIDKIRKNKYYSTDDIIGYYNCVNDEIVIFNTGQNSNSSQEYHSECKELYLSVSRSLDRSRSSYIIFKKGSYNIDSIMSNLILQDIFNIVSSEVFIVKTHKGETKYFEYANHIDYD